MGFRFYRRVNLFPGVSLNLGRRGASLSVGPRGMKTTFGRNGARTSVGIPGTGMRYEKRWGGAAESSGGGNISPWYVLAVIFGVIAYFCYLFMDVRRSDGFVIAMIASGVAAVVSFLIGLATSSKDEPENTGVTTYSSALRNTRYDNYVRDLARSVEAFYAFLKELNRSTRCRNMLKNLLGMEAFDREENVFSINKRLAVIVYCDLRDCFRELGYDEGRLEGLSGIGYAMIIKLLLKSKDGLSLFYRRDCVPKLLKIIGDLKTTTTIRMDIEDHDDEFRFSFLFGTVNSEHEWVSRYATLMYRWASLIAKADGQISSDESETLAAIMKMKESKCEGNVKVSSGGSVSAPASVVQDEGDDEPLDFGSRVIKLISETHRASTSHFQRYLGVGYNRSAALCDFLEDLGVISRQERNEPRRVLIDDVRAQNALSNPDDSIRTAINRRFPDAEMFSRKENKGFVGDLFSDDIRDEQVDSEAPSVKEQNLNRSHSSAGALRELDDLIGLDPVKNDVKMLANFIKIQRKRKASGLKEAPISYHCVFTGNPGTGKTTVARILADVYRSMGVLKKGHLVETDRSGLVGEYVGHTAVKTNKIIDSALDGVLFIDEAYTLVQGGDHDYGGEAIATLLKRMEDDRDRLVVILAGYTDEMKKFIDSNPGLQSRFNRYIQFPDYTAEELAQIFLLTAERSQYTCNADVRASLKDIMKNAVEAKDKNFGNGRFVRNLFEKSIQRQAVRLSTVRSVTTEMLAELTLHDLGFKYDE